MGGVAVTIATSGPEVGTGTTSAGWGAKDCVFAGLGLRAWRKQRCVLGAGIRSYIKFVPKARNKEENHRGLDSEVVCRASQMRRGRASLQEC